MESIPSGYKELLALIMEGQLNDKEKVYLLCEDFWTGLNNWYSDMGIDYRLKDLPI